MTRRELALATATGLVGSLVVTWPLVLHLGTRLPTVGGNRADPLLEAWTLAWDGHALLHDPWRFFDANVFWPLGRTLAFSESLAGLTPFGLFGTGTRGPILGYDLAVLFAYVLAFVGAYALARELGARHGGAAFAGAVFAWTPFRLAQLGHLHVLSSGGIPLALALLLRGHRTQRASLIVAGWLVALWQISLGWNLGLPFVYLLGAIAVVVVVVLRRTSPARAVVVAWLAGGAVAFGGAALLAVPYLEVVHDHPEARRTPDILFFFSPAPRSLLAAPSQDVVWRDATASLRLEPEGEKSLFIGAAALLAASAGLAAGGWPRRRRLLLAVAAATFAVLSLGFGVHGGQGGYRVLYDHAPGWQGLRTPGRLTTFTALAIALLAATGIDRIAGLLAERVRWAAGAFAATCVAVALVEGIGSVDVFRPDAPPPPTPSPRLVLPADRDDTNALAMFWSIGQFAPVANGWSGFHPTSYTQLVDSMRSFPDRGSVRVLEHAGIRSVVLDRTAARGTPWAAAAQRPVRGLSLRRTQQGRFVVYVLPRAAAR